MIDIGVTLDERIADGYYFSKSLRMFKQFLQTQKYLINHYIRRVIELNELNELKQEYRVNGIRAPWLKNYGDVPHTLTPDCTMVEPHRRSGTKIPKALRL